ncbi:MAG: hypothetical protein J7K04_10040 [Spirochaetales bacterium]|nr:hypothetical protein [Spirochaetales bacterium]
MEGKKEKDEALKAWVVTVDMGLGHQRATYPLKDIAEGGIITAGGKGFADDSEKKLWDRMRKSYEFLSRVRSVPIIGKPIFGILDRLQNIPPFYPIKDMSNPSPQVKLIKKYIEKGLSKGALEIVKQKPLPLISSHPIPALAADYHGFSRNYCIIADAEIARAWVAMDPRKSHIHYLAPCGRAVMRLRTYGVPDERIFLTGFPFPLKLLGDKNLSLLKYDAAQRLHYLDPNNRFWPLHHVNVEYFLGKRNCHFKEDRVLTITYAVGGAGAQKEIGYKIAKSMREKLAAKQLRLNLVAGIREEVRDYFDNVKKEFLPGTDNIRIIYGATKEEYFEKFSDTVRETDILWTKPSELSFYSGLGIPIIMSPTIGSQEEFNRRWLLEIQAGIDQYDPEYSSEWLFDLLREGRLAESAWDGFLKARKYGTYKILEILETGTMTRETSPLKR